jgi:menaquinone-dependent protoporphyrinogen oxidase
VSSPACEVLESEEEVMKVLVAYATRHGATKGIAERIAQTLGPRGHEVTLEPADRVSAVAAYDAFIVGGAAYAGHWLKGATEFVRKHREVLASRPVWLFSSGPIGTDLVDAKGRDVFEAARPAEFAEFAGSIHPRDEAVFFGAFDPDAKPIGLMERFGSPFMRMPAVREAMPAGDFRDWPQIDAWAEGIARELEAAPSPAAAPV